MPVIPTFENTAAVPTAPGPPRVGLDQFSEPGAALAQAGGAVSAEGQQWLAQYAEAKRQSDASALTAQGMQALAEKRFQWSHTDDSQAAFTGYQADASSIIKNTVAQTNDPLVRQYVQRALTTQGIIDSENVRRAAFALESSKQRGQLDATLAGYAHQAALAPDDLTRAHYVDLATQAIQGAAAGHWLLPQQAADQQINFTSQVAEVKARQMLAADPVTAAHVLEDPRLTAEQFPGLLPERAATLAGVANFRAMRVEERSAAAQAHADAMASRKLHMVQQSVETQVLSDVYDGKPVDMNQVTELARKGLIAPGGLNTIHSAMMEGQAGHDNTNAVIDLYGELQQGKLTTDDIHAAVSAHSIKGTTALELMRALNEQDKQQESALDRSNFATLRTALGIDANGQSLFSFNKAQQKAAQQAKWAEAQQEWTRRVLIQHQDSTAVLQDMLPRYEDLPQSLDALPRPQFGPVADNHSLHVVALSTLRAWQNHEINQATYDREVDLLNRYRAILQANATTRAPASPTSPAPRRSSGSRSVAPGGSVEDKLAHAGLVPGPIP